jgi:hypothetical protein
MTTYESCQDEDGDGFVFGNECSFMYDDTDMDGLCDDTDPEPDCATNDTDECGVCAGLGAEFECADGSFECTEEDCPDSEAHFVVNLEDTGESQLTIFSDSITSLSPGDEVGVFDLEAITNYNDCSNQIGELLVGAGTWDGNQLNLVSTGSVDLCAFGGPQLAGFVQGNDVVVKVYKTDEGVEYDTELTWGVGTGSFGDVIQQVSEITLVDGNACEDDNDATAAFGGCAGAVAALGCDFVFGGSAISELCPETCGECEEEPVCEDDNDATAAFGGCAGAGIGAGAAGCISSCGRCGIGTSVLSLLPTPAPPPPRTRAASALPTPAPPPAPIPAPAQPPTSPQ